MFVIVTDVVTNVVTNATPLVAGQVRKEPEGRRRRRGEDGAQRLGQVEDAGGDAGVGGGDAAHEAGAGEVRRTALFSPDATG